jgi:hypothetical protein
LNLTIEVDCRLPNAAPHEKNYVPVLRFPKRCLDPQESVRRRSSRGAEQCQSRISKEGGRVV